MCPRVLAGILLEAAAWIKLEGTLQAARLHTLPSACPSPGWGTSSSGQHCLTAF